MNEDRRITIAELAEATSISWSSCQRILSDDLGMRRVAAKFVPRLLTTEQKEKRLSMCTELKNELESDADLFSKIITGDETWFYGYDPETKQQSSQWKTKNSPRPKKVREVRSNVKTMLIVFFDCRGIIHKEFVPHGQTVNQHYLEVLRRLRENVRRKRPELWASGDWLLHHDNTPPHTALSVRRYLASQGWTMVTHAPYSPDLAPCDFFLFPRMKRDLKGMIFEDVEEVKSTSQAALQGISIDEFQRCFEQWKNRLDKCVATNGEYFEGDYISFYYCQ